MRTFRRQTVALIASGILAGGVLFATPAVAATLNQSVPAAGAGAVLAGNAINLVTGASGGGYTNTTNSQSTYLVGGWWPPLPHVMCEKQNRFYYAPNFNYTNKYFMASGCSNYLPGTMQWVQWDPPALRTGSSYCGYTKNSLSGSWSGGACVGVVS